MKKLSVMLCLIALLAFTLNGCGGSGTTDTSYYGGGDSGSTTTTPTVTSCTTNLTPGQTCTINGSGFGGSRDSGLSSVSFVPQLTGGTTLTGIVLTWSDTVVTCITPGVITGVQYVIVINRYTSSGTVSSSSTFVAGVNGTTGTAPTTAPAIASQTPNPATAGASVTLTGTNFPTSGGYVTINSTVGSATFTTTTAVFTIPSGTATGAAVTINGGTGGVSNTFSLVIGPSGTTPTITTVTPNPVALGSTLTIVGTNLGATAGTVTVGTVTLTGLVWAATGTQVTGTLPATGLTLGSTYTLTLTTSAAATATSSVRISNPATDPTITSITPSAITQGVATAVAIVGTKLGGTAGTLSINTVPATTLTNGAWADTLVNTTIPATVAAGTYVLTLTTSGGVTATGGFTVTTTPITTKTWHTAQLQGSQNALPAAGVSGTMAVLSTGSPVFVYLQPDGTTASPTQHVFARIQAGTTFGAASQLDNAATMTASSCTFPTVACDSNGHALAVWMQNGTVSGVLARHIYSNYYTGSIPWSTTQLAATTVDQVAFSPTVAATNLALSFDSNDSAVCIWDTGVIATGIVSRQFSGGTWGTSIGTIIQAAPANLAVPVGFNFRFVPGTRQGIFVWGVRAAADAQARMYARKLDTSTGGGAYATTQYGGITTTQLDPVVPTFVINGNPRLSLNSTGGIAGYNFDCGVAPFHIETNTWTAANDTWTAAAQVDIGDCVTAIPPFNIAHLSTGSPICTYDTCAGAATVLKANIQTSGVWGATPTAISGNVVGFGQVDSGFHALSSDGSAGAIAIFIQRAPLARLFSAPYANGAWTPPTTVASTLDAGDQVNLIPPVLTHNGLGNAFAAFARTSDNRWYTNLYY